MKTKVTFASVRPTTGWKLTFEGTRKQHFVRVYTRGGEEVMKDLTTGKIYEKLFSQPRPQVDTDDTE